MKIQNLKTKLIAPTLLLIPMAYMHLGDGHHSGSHHSMSPDASFQSSIHERTTGDMSGLEETTTEHHAQEIPAYGS